jgi:hypothetical protein
VIDQFVKTTNGTFWNEMKVTIRTFDLTNEWALVAGYTSVWRIDSRSLCKAFLVQLRPFRFISPSSIDDQTISTAETLIYNRDYDLSVSFDSSSVFAAIGAPRLNRVVLVQISESALYASISSEMSGYGRSRNARCSRRNID